ncbi:tripartite tricarboxylate transporter substrate binding protein [Variovorax paradoxus]|nr:tripartite tricarboxylate transporter substrate binding protein [Variovorax paradoxus]MBT2305453.1 tripartite tricarboxylate transporter substrate binding protein [Variovorax paradoxus]
MNLKPTRRAEAAADRTTISRRNAILGCAALLLAPHMARAQVYPNRPLKLLIGYTPGGAADALGRLMAQKYGEALGQPVVVENRPGANATLAAAAVAKASGDGYTLLLNTGPDSTIGPLTMPTLPYSVQKDFAPISRLIILPSVLVVPADSPIRNVADLMKAARDKPGRLNYGSFGNGSSAHMSAELSKSLTSTYIVHIPFKGSAPAMSELLASRIDLMFDTFASAWPHVQAGKLRALAVTTATRVPLAPEVPTMQEAGVRGFVSQAFIGVAAPAQTPPAIIERLQIETTRILAMPDVRERIVKLGMIPAPSGSAEFAAFLKSETERNRKLIKEAKLQFDN